MNEPYDSLSQIPIAGYIPNSTVDFPDNISMTIFIKGCPFKCSYCHNPELSFLANDTSEPISPILGYITERKNWVDAVVLSGGEPTLYPQIEHLFNYIKDNGLLTGLHTNGFYPATLTYLLKKQLIDFIGMDIKAPLDERYDKITGIKNSYNSIKKSLRAVLKANIKYEIRTTFHNALLSDDDMIDLVTTLSDIGVEYYSFHRFNPQGVHYQKLIDSYNPTSQPFKAIDLAQNKFKSFTIK